ncbi:MAG: cupin domain-containing protein [Succinivibrio sp.]|nr:cupin domain-containing protein [Succinivibrio sp.]
MTLIIDLTPDFMFKDERGSLTQLTRRGFSQVNFITSVRGAVRGGHYHRFNAEAFYVVAGACRVSAVLGGEREDRIFRAGDYFLIPPLVRHSFLYLDDTQLISMYSLGAELSLQTEQPLMDIFADPSDAAADSDAASQEPLIPDIPVVNLKL